MILTVLLYRANGIPGYFGYPVVRSNYNRDNYADPAVGDNLVL